MQRAAAVLLSSNVWIGYPFEYINGYSSTQKFQKLCIYLNSQSRHCRMIRIVDGMRQEVYSKGKEMHNQLSGQWFLKRKIMMMKVSNFGDSQVEQ